MDSTYNPLTYRLGRQGFIYNSVIVNILDMIIVWIASVALILVFMLLRIIFMPFGYWGEHFADLERSFRY
jgi:hypothetical protein